MADRNEPRAKKSPDEVDLVEVFVSIIHFFRKNSLIFLVASVLGLGLGGAYFKLKKNVYASKMVAECMSLPDGRVVDLILVLDNLREAEDWPQLAKVLNMSVDEVKLIKKFEPISSVGVDKAAKGVDDYLLPTQAVSYLFSVIVHVKDNRILPSLQNGIVYYLSGNEYSKLRVSRFIENRTSLMNYIDKEMRKLDSVNVLYANKVMSSKDGESILTSPGDYKAIMINLQEKKLTCEDELKYAQPVRIFQGFTAFTNPVEPVLPLSLLIGFLVMNGVGLGYIVVRELAAVYRNKNNQTA